MEEKLHYPNAEQNPICRSISVKASIKCLSEQVRYRQEWELGSRRRRGGPIKV